MTDVAGPELVGLWLNVFSDQADAKNFHYMTSLSRNKQVSGRVEKYGEGRLRAYVEEGATKQWSVSIYGISPEEKEWLEDRIGEQFIVRDDRGNRIFAVYFGVDITEHSYNKDGSLPLTFSEVTDTLAV